MKLCACLSLSLLLFSGCSGVDVRKQEQSAAFGDLSASERDLVSRGQIEKGMSTNAVYIAWGKPSAVSSEPASNGPGTDQTWVYYADKPVITPAWVYMPSQFGYWSLEYFPEHHSEAYTKAQVIFRNGRVLSWSRE
jgi:hypothetical protein